MKKLLIPLLFILFGVIQAKAQLPDTLEVGMTPAQFRNSINTNIFSIYDSLAASNLLIEDIREDSIPVLRSLINFNFEVISDILNDSLNNHHLRIQVVEDSVGNYSLRLLALEAGGGLIPDSSRITYQADTFYVGNSGTGIKIYQDAGDLVFLDVNSGTPYTLAQLAAGGSGTTYVAGPGILITDGDTIKLDSGYGKTLYGGTDISITENDTAIIINSTASGGSGGSGFAYLPLEFIIGETIYAPSNGDSSLINTKFSDYFVRLYRDGLLLSRDSLNGITIDTDTVWVHPPFSTGEQYIVELIDTSGISSFSLENLISYNAEFDTVLMAMTYDMHDTLKTIYNTFVDSLVSSGIWAKTDWLHVGAVPNNDNGEALINWIRPGTNDAIEVNGPVPWTALEGYRGDSLNSCRISTSFDATVDGVNYTQNSASISFYSAKVSNGSFYSNTQYNGNFAQASHDDVTTVQNWRINSGTSVTQTNVETNPIAFWSHVRDSNTTTKIYKNGILDDSEVDETSSGLPLGNIHFYSTRTFSEHSNYQFPIFIITSSLNSDESARLYNFSKTLMSGLGKDVID